MGHPPNGATCRTMQRRPCAPRAHLGASKSMRVRCAFSQPFQRFVTVRSHRASNLREDNRERPDRSGDQRRTRGTLAQAHPRLHVRVRAHPAKRTSSAGRVVRPADQCAARQLRTRRAAAPLNRQRAHCGNQPVTPRTARSPARRTRRRAGPGTDQNKRYSSGSIPRSLS